MNENNIVVMGGSFNPPTIAHFRIMQTALNAVNARTGYFVPVGYPYLKRKMAKLGQSHLALSDELRLKMLEAMADSDERIRIYRDAMSETFSDDAGVAAAIQEKHAGADVYYVSGDDKIGLLETFVGKDAFFDRFRCILFSRDGCAMDKIEGSERLRPYRNAFVPVESDPENGHVSSTAIRAHLFEMDAVADMLHPAVVPILRELRQEEYPEEILQFKDEFAFLSNDFPAETEYEGIVYPCAGSAFLASKFESRAERVKIAGMGTDRAKMKYSAEPGSSEWQEMQTEIMEDIVRAKFMKNPALLGKLLQTGSRRIINGGRKDRFWGVNLITWEGENRLGNILMKLREEWRNNA